MNKVWPNGPDLYYSWHAMHKAASYTCMSCYKIKYVASKLWKMHMKCAKPEVKVSTIYHQSYTTYSLDQVEGPSVQVFVITPVHVHISLIVNTFLYYDR